MTSNIVLVFVDGFGLGSDDPQSNPLATDEFPAFHRLMGNQPVVQSAPQILDSRNLAKGVDANLGMEGLPQSGTGQASLFTGVNCARLAGRHYGPFPHSTSRPVINYQNVFRRLVDVGLTCTFANPYPARFFEWVERTGRWTVTTLCCTAAGVSLRTGDDLIRGEAVSADITGETWPVTADRIQPITAREAGLRLARIAADHRFTLFEYFATDKAGHSLDFERARTILKRLDAFLGGVLTGLAEIGGTLIVTSDHGNIEDMSIKTHTRNPVPFLVEGPSASEFAAVKSLTDVTPAVVAILSGNDYSGDAANG